MTLLEDVMKTLEEVDVLQTEYTSVVDMNAELKGSLTEQQMRNKLLEERCSDLEAERASLLEVHDELVKTAMAQYDFREKYEQLLLSSSGESDRQREDARRETEALQTQLRALREQESSERALRVAEIERLQSECSEKEGAMSVLQKDLEAAQRGLLEAKRERDEAQSKEQRKYQAELRLLQNTIKDLEVSKSSLQDEVKKAEHEAMTARMKLEEQLRDSGSNRHVEIFKQKVMQLRRENEDLKRRLQSAAPR